MTKISCAAVIVVYHPAKELFMDLLKAISKQVDAIVIIDNSANNTVEIFLEQMQLAVKTELLQMNKNIGLGAGHNKGIQWAEANGFNYVLLLDQDSLPAANMVAELLEAHNKLAYSGHKIAAVGPVYVEARTSVKSPFERYENGKLELLYADKDDNNGIIATNYLITSGTLAHIAIFHEIGYFDEGLFIDFVDIEWGLRAANKKFCCYGICSAILYHRIGDDIFKWKRGTIAIHSPLRKYYIFRNRVLLYKRSYIFLAWKFRDMLRVLRMFQLHLFYLPDRRRYFPMIFLGLYHGLLGRTGKYEG